MQSSISRLMFSSSFFTLTPVDLNFSMTFFSSRGISITIDALSASISAFRTLINTPVSTTTLERIGELTTSDEYSSKYLLTLTHPPHNVSAGYYPDNFSVFIHHRGRIHAFFIHPPGYYVKGFVFVCRYHLLGHDIRQLAYIAC